MPVRAAGYALNGNHPGPITKASAGSPTVAIALGMAITSQASPARNERIGISDARVGDSP
jgi:hypothetical protein